MKRMRSATLYVLMTACCLLASGIGNRYLSVRIGEAMGDSLALSGSLAALPLDFGFWVGTDVPLEEGITSIPNFDDDCIYRRYTNQHKKRSVHVFVGYTGRPRTRLGHRPDVCYAANGWDQLSQKRVTFSTSGGRQVLCLLYQFRHPKKLGPQQMVLAAYIANGSYCTDPLSYNRAALHDRRLFATHHSYLARIQLSLNETGDSIDDELLLKDLALKVVPYVEDLMPYWDE